VDEEILNPKKTVEIACLGQSYSISVDDEAIPTVYQTQALYLLGLTLAVKTVLQPGYRLLA